MVKLLFSCFFFLLFWLWQLWQNSYKKIILCVQQKNYSYSTSYLYIQRNNYFHSINYLHIQLKIMFIPQIISIFNKINFSISWFFFMFNEKPIYIQRIVYILFNKRFLFSKLWTNNYLHLQRIRNPLSHLYNSTIINLAPKFSTWLLGSFKQIFSQGWNVSKN